MVDLLTTQVRRNLESSFHRRTPSSEQTKAAAPREICSVRGVFSVLLCWSVECVVWVLCVDELKDEGLEC